MLPTLYIHRVTGQVFKLLRMKEEEAQGNTVFLSEYLDSLVISMRGAFDTFPELTEDYDYVTIVNIMHYISRNEVEQRVFRREVLKVLGLLNKVEKIVVGGD